MSSWYRVLWLCCASTALGVPHAVAQESGYQTINGTRVFTQIDHASDTATFSNECGSQTLSHQALGAGAIPSDIIPCPRPGQRTQDPSPPPQETEDAATLAENEREGEQRFASGMQSYKAAQWMAANLAFSFAQTSFNLARNKDKAQQAENYSAATTCASNFYNSNSVDDLQSALSACRVIYWQGIIKSNLNAARAQRPSLRSGTPAEAPPSADCSDISGTGDSSQTKPCTDLNWTMATPSNHSHDVVRLHRAEGPDLLINNGQGLHRMLNGELVVEDISHGFAMEDGANCRSLDMSLGFVVLGCEVKRQQEEYNRLKSNSGDAYSNYMDSTNSNTQGQNSGNLTRTTAFRFMYNGQPHPGIRSWTVDSDNQWHEAYPDGHEAKVFDQVARGAANNCEGAVARQSSDNDFQVFIPDQGCDRMIVLFRRGSGAWNSLAAMQDVR